MRCSIRPLAPLLLTALIVSLLGSASSHAADPSLRGILPQGFQRGTEVDVQLQGVRLKDAEALLLYRTGVRVVELKPEADNKIQVKMAIEADCPLGFHGVRIRTATGISNLQTFSVGALPEVQEKEPNNDFDKPQIVPLGCTINGVIKNEDVDYFLVKAKKGQRISVELEGVRLGMPPGNDTFFDPFVAILNAKRFELDRCDDTPLLQQDSLCAIMAPEDGDYIVQVRESAYGGNDLCRYRLHVGQFPRPTAVLPPGGRPGQTGEVKWIGDVKGDWIAPVAFPTDAGADVDMFAQDAQGIAPSPLRVRVNDLENTVEIEPNNGRDQATLCAAPGALNGAIEQPGDVDCYKFSAKKGQVFDIRVIARKTLRSPLDSVLSVTRSNGAGVGGNDDSGGPDSYYRFTAPADDDYVVTVRDQLLDGAPDFVYRIELTPIASQLVLSLPERVQYVPVTVSVPRNNRMAIMVNAARANFGGELKLAFEDLPPGISVGDVKMAANQSSVPMLFAAAKDAAKGGALVDVIGRPTDEKQAVVGHLKQRTMLVRGQNNRDVWGHDADRMAVAVTEESPFEIEIVPPKVPIVRNGAMQLKIVAKRKDGFKEPIAVFMLYNPPGIGSSGSISIPAGKNEITIPLTANNSAGIGTWPIVVLGRAKVGNGNLELASQMINLEVADTFFNFAFEKSAAELGQETEVLVRVEKKRDFEGKATAQLLGLPAKTTLAEAKPIEFTQDTKELVFKVKIAADARPGKFQTLVCRAIVTRDNEPITHTLGSGEFRIDKPLPPKADAPKPKPKPAAKPAAKPVKKRLSRLEQLRQDKKKQ